MADATRATAESGRALLPWIIILALVAAVLWLASERNAHQYALAPEEGRLVVKKGILFPTGQRTYRPDDPALSQAYAPLTPPPGSPLPSEQTFDDRGALDQGLYAILSRWARAEMATERPDRVERALEYLTRADRLPGISAAQRDDLRTVRAESGWFEGRELLERGAEALRQARDKLRMAAEAPTRHAGDATSLLRQVEPLADDASRLSRTFAPQPGKSEPTPPPAPPAPSDGSAPPATAPGPSGGTTSSPSP